MTYYTSTTSSFTPTGDYILDWNLTGADGAAVLASASGNQDVAVTVSTPTNVEGKDFTLGSDGMLVSDDNASEPVQTVITFDHEVTDVTFQLVDVDQGWDFDDKVTILAYDADGNLVDVDFSDLDPSHHVDGNSVEGGASLDGYCETDADNVTVSIAGPITSLVIVQEDGSSADEAGVIRITDLGFNAIPNSELDGIVEGTAGDDLIDTGYEGDPDGDMVDHGDAILPGETGDDDIIVAGAGDDTILAGEGDDEVYAGSGDDVIEGGAGDDVIYGDSDGGYATGDTTEREVLQWDEAPYYADERDAGTFTQNTGTVDVTFKVLSEHCNAEVEYEDAAGNVDGIDTGTLGAADPHSGLALEGDGKYDDAKVQLSFSDAVSNVQFRINDIDYDSTVTVLAFDADGHAVEVDLTGGADLRIDDDTASATGCGLEPTASENSLLVEIAGPVTKIQVIHDIVGSDTSHIQLTDVYFDAVTDGVDPNCETGNDTITGGEGADMMYGETGNDTFIVSSAEDGAGDVVVGGNGPNDTTDHDVLDLRGAGKVTIDQSADATDDGAYTGTVTFADGGTLSFSQVEEILTDPQNDAPDAANDTATTDEDTPVVINVLANDTDPDGDALTVVDATSTDGAVTINPDGTLTFEPAPDFNGTATIDYMISDGNGGFDTAKVTVCVTPVNDEPEAVDDVASTAEDTPVVIPVLNNDSDVDGDPLTVTEATSPNGDVTINPDGTLTFTPDENFNGTTEISYTIDDGNGGTDTATVTVEVCPVNDAPDAVDDSAKTALETPVTIVVLANDSDPDGDPLTVTEASTTDGSVAINPDGTITFTPASGFDGVATVNYTISDGNGGSDSAVVSILVNDGIVEGTTGDDLIDLGYTGDPEGDMVDNNDAILPGEAPNDDIIEAYGGDDEIHAGLGDDEVFAGDGDDLVYGEDGNDTIYGGDGSDEVYGGDGDDVIDTSGPNEASDYGWPPFVPEDTDKTNDIDFVDGGAGNDTITTGDDADTIFGGSGNDYIDGGLDDDTIDGGDDDDFIIGGHGSDTIDGGAGDDTIYGGLGPDPSLDPLNIVDAYDPRPDNGIDVIHGGDGNDVIFGQDDDDVLYGDAGDDYIDGGIDEDTIYGGDGDDTLLGGQGNDVIYGGAGADSMSGGDDRDLFAQVNVGDKVDGNEGGDDWDTLDLTGSAPKDGSLKVTYTTPDQENGFVTYFDKDGNDVGNLEFLNIEKIIPCFTPGTMIATPKGERRVEELEPGDRVITRDNGIQEIKWVGHKPIGFRELASAEHLKPVLIRAGALGNGLPERDMMVSPNHRLLVANDRTTLYFDEREVLAAAKHLVDNKGISIVEPLGVTYIHFMFDHHEVVLSDGAWTESFQPGDYSLKGLGNAQRQELFELFPELETREGIEDYAAARRVLKKHEAKMLVVK